MGLPTMGCMVLVMSEMAPPFPFSPFLSHPCLFVGSSTQVRPRLCVAVVVVDKTRPLWEDYALCTLVFFASWHSGQNGNGSSWA